MNNRTLHLKVRANENVFTPERIEYHNDNVPAGEPLSRTVQPSIIGYWVEIHNKSGHAIYRRFIHHLPHNLDLTWASWSNRQRSKATFVIKAPILDASHKIILYEQKITAPSQHKPVQQCHFSLLLFPPSLAHQQHNYSLATSF